MTDNDSEANSPRFRRASHVAWRKIGNETVVLDLRAKRAFGLNEAGGALWHALVELPEGAGVALASSERDAQAFLAELASLGLIEAVSDGMPGSSTPLLAGFRCSPKVTWSDEIRAFGGSVCGKTPGGGGGCSSFPQTA